MLEKSEMLRPERVKAVLEKRKKVVGYGYV